MRVSGGALHGVKSALIPVSFKVFMLHCEEHSVTRDPPQFP